MGGRVRASMITQEYKPYWDWECFNNGMWENSSADKTILLNTAIDFTSNDDLYGHYMDIVVFQWRNTMIHHLTNPSINKKAFIGHCACSYARNLPESIVRKAWKYLSNNQQDKANDRANKAYLKWLSNYKKELKTIQANGNQGVTQEEYQMKFL